MKTPLLNSIRSKYQAKRSSKKWKRRKRYNNFLRFYAFKKQYLNDNILNYVAPSIFSFIDNTDEVLTYFNDIKSFINKNTPMFLDIQDIEVLTPDSIALQIALLSDSKSKRIGLGGNSPKKEELKTMFLESGLYNYVISRVKTKSSVNNKLWKHSKNNEIKGNIAGDASDQCRALFTQNLTTFSREDLPDTIYNLLVEAMSNTKTHANKGRKIISSNLNWWLYYYIDEVNSLIKYSFIDLGIGIFESASFKSYKKKISALVGNQILVKPFLEGKIVSSRENDTKISGKGVKQIMATATYDEIKRFYIISNDLKIDVKNKNGIKLSSNFGGTFIYFEIKYK